MTLVGGYLQSLKALEVEEPIDVYVHRPLAYVLARAAFRTPVTPNMITACSIVLGVLAAAMLLLNFPHHLQWAGGFIFASAITDCADGQLARMRQSFSAFGRMLDGAADLVVCCVSVSGGLWMLWSSYSARPLYGATVVALGLLTVLTGSFHTSAYDHYKNLYLRFTHASGGEGEDYQAALERSQRSADLRFWVRGAWALYLFYVKSQSDFIKGFDPASAVPYSELPQGDARAAEVYRKQNAGLIRWWRGFFGFGSLVFGLSVSITFEVMEYYMLFRLVALNGLFYGYLRGAQRRASLATFSELGKVITSGPCGPSLPASRSRSA
jgi:phosphatidylglycerophosphate synthase